MRLYHDLCESKPRREHRHLAKVSNTTNMTVFSYYGKLWGKKEKRVLRGHHPWRVYISRKAVFFSRAIGFRPLRKGPIHCTSCFTGRTAHMHWVLAHQYLSRMKASSAVWYQTEIKRALAETLERYRKESQTYTLETSPSGNYVNKK